MSGQLTNYTYTGKAYLCLEVLDSMSPPGLHVVDSTLISGGSFSLNLTTPQWLINPTTDTSCHPTLGNSTGKIAVAFFYVHDSTGNLIGAALRSNYDTNGYVAGKFVDAFVYSTAAYSASGTTICTDTHDTVTYSITGQVCWNLIVGLYVDVYNGVLTKSSESNTEPAGAKWYFISVANSDKPALGLQRRNF